MGILASSTASSSAAKPIAIVIGAGVSGLSCASQLVKAGHAVLVLEARDRVGGRTHTYTDDRIGAPMDLGASFIHGIAGNPLHVLAKRDNLALYRPDNPQQPNPRIFGPDGPPIADELAARLGFNSRRTIFETSKFNAQERQQAYPAVTDSLATYVLNEKESPLFDGLETEIERGYAISMSESWDGWTGAALKDTNLRYWQSDVTYGGPDATIINGYQGIYKPLAEEVYQSKTSEIRLNEEVTSIKLSEDGDSVDVETKSNNGDEPSTNTFSTYTAPYCVCTLPLGVLQERPPAFSPALPKRRLDAIARIGMGVLNRVIITYPKCFWPSAQSFITFLPSEASAAFMPVLRKRAMVAQNYLPITGKNTLHFFFGATSGSQLEKMTDEQVGEGVHSVLRHHFAGQTKDFPAQPDSVIVTRWKQDIYSCGSYSYIRPAKGGESDLPTPYDFAELSRPQWDHRLFFAGEATDPDHYATVHGPLMTGRREAQRILDELEAKALET